MEEFELFDQCAYTIGVTQYGTWGGDTGFLFGPGGTQAPAGARDGYARVRQAAVRLPGFPGEEPPSIECNEDAGEEFIDG